MPGCCTVALVAIVMTATGSGQPDHVLRLLLVDVGDQADGGLHHLDGVAAEETALIVNKLAPEAHVGVDNGAPALAVLVGLVQRHALVLHEVGYAYTS